MASLKDIIDCIEELAPPALAEDWDNTGMQVGGEDKDITGLLIALDPLPYVVDEAAKNGCELVITHHPLFFKPIRRLDILHSQGAVAGAAIRRGISIYSAHTSLDKVPYGVSDALSRPLGLVRSVPLVRAEGWPRGFGFGKLGEMSRPVTAMELAARLKETFGLKDARLTGDPERVITKAAVCGGSGSDLIHAAKAAGADIYITGDIKYHEALDEVESGMCILDVGHYASELPVVEHFASLIRGATEQKKWDIKVMAATPRGEPWTVV